MSGESPVALYLAEVKCLIVEPSAPFLQNITACLVELGAKKQNIEYAVRFEDALIVAQKSLPKLVVMEYQIGEKFGLELVELIDKQVGEQNRIAVFATRVSSDSAVAEAAEEQVDAFILKPFSMNDFRIKIEEAIQRKAAPSPYHQKIRSGKSAIASREWDKAIQEFEAAKELSEKPSLAYYYSGLVTEKLKGIAIAIGEYKLGLNITPLHYKCLVGEFDALYNDKKFVEAYQLVQDIRANYPVSPQRFGKILVTAVYSKNLNDLPELYKIFQSFSNRPRELVKITTATLKLAAKVMLKENNKERAFQYYEMGSIASQLSWEYMSEAVRDLIKADAIAEAEEIYKKVARQYTLQEDYQIIGFYIKAKSGPLNETFETGKKLLSSLSRGEPDLYRILADLAIRTNRDLMAEDIVNRGVTEFPELRQELYARLK